MSNARRWTLLSLLLLSGCLSPSRRTSDVECRVLDVGFPPVHGQYAAPADPAAPVALYEVYLVNTGVTSRAFTEVTLDGRRLTQPASALLGPQNIAIDGHAVRLPDAPSDPDLFWWQFYPSADLPPGGSAVLQLCFRDDVRTPRVLTVADASGIVIPWTIPRRARQPAPRIAAVTYAHDLSRLFVQCASPGSPPEAFWINGRLSAPVRTLAGADPRTPVLAELRPLSALAPGLPLDVRVRFAGGIERRALVRVLKGIVLDAPGDIGGRRRAKELHLSADPDVLMIPIDATCDDLREGGSGASAWAVVGERQRAWRRRPEKLAGFGFCTAVTPVTAAIYGRIADAVYAKPYQLGWGTDPARFLDRETDILAAQREAAAPLPFLYIPERFARRGRHLAPAELEVLQWSALAAGAKGLRWHFGMNKGGLDATPGLIPVLQRAGEQIRRLEPLLAPLVPVADETQGDEKSGYVRVLTAWCGSRGVLYLVRDRNLGAIPGDMPVRKDVRVELDVPPWCRGASVLDLLGGERLAVSRPGRLPLTLAGLSGFRLLWIDADPGQAALDTFSRKGGL